jgi:putative colanic acid biosynthesis glycosyltransferase
LPEKNLYSNNKIIGGRRQKGNMGKYVPGFPLVSIITPVFNAENEIERNIEVVQLQTYPNIEHIIIDGGSTDRTLKVLQRKDADVDYWLSEADAGIYDAMNKGIDAATGEWIYFLGVDDYFYRHDTLVSVMESARITDDVTLVLGNIFYPDGKVFRSRLDKTIFLKNTIHHQGALYRRSVFKNFRYGRTLSSGLKKNFIISGDYQLNLHLFTGKAKYIYIDEIIARCGRGISMEGRFTGYLEEINIRHLYMHFVGAVFFDILTLLRYGWKKFDIRNYCKL